MAKQDPMENMCDFCGNDSSCLYPFGPIGELYVCDGCKGIYGPQAREIAFKVKKNISDNIVKFLSEGYFHVAPDMKEWIKENAS